jgi:hypothetical protein
MVEQCFERKPPLPNTKIELRDQRSLKIACNFLIQRNKILRNSLSFNEKRERVTQISKHWITTDPGSITYQIQWDNSRTISFSKQEYNQFFMGENKIDFSCGKEVTY